MYKDKKEPKNERPRPSRDIDDMIFAFEADSAVSRR